MSLHLSGDLGGARLELEAAIGNAPRDQRTTTVYLGFEGKILAGAVLARTLWLQGHPAQAAERARQTVRNAERMDHPLTLCIALIWAISVFFWTGDLQAAEQYLGRLVSCAELHCLAPHLLVGRGFEGELAIRRGDVSEGVARLRSSLQELHAAPYELLTTAFNITLVQGLAAAGRFAEAAALIDHTIRQVDANGDCCYMPELLRSKGRLLLAMSQTDDGELCFVRSLEASRQQGALAWELRTAIDLAGLLVAQGRGDSARALLQPVFEDFAEGRDTADLRAAERLLAMLDPSDLRRSGSPPPRAPIRPHPATSPRGRRLRVDRTRSR
jgi:predicted ATPase